MKHVYDHMKKITACLLSVLLAFSMNFDVMAENEAEEETEKEVLVIKNREDWNAFADACRLDAYSQNLRVVLENDLNVEGCHSVPTFGGTFDGGGHTIKGISLMEEGDVQGLFRYVREGAVIRDLTVSGTVSPAESPEKTGLLAGENRGNLISCRAMGFVTGSVQTGGITGVNEQEGKIDHCEMVSGAISGEKYSGGIAGENYGSIVNSSNYASVNTRSVEKDPDFLDFDWEKLNSIENVPAATDTGGIAGFSDGIISKCENHGRIGHPRWGYNVGGVVGRQSGLISQCSNFARVEGRKDVGGIAGQTEPYTELKYQKSTLQKLADELDRLNGVINDTFHNTDGTREDISSILSDIIGFIDGAEDNISGLLDGFAEVGEESVDSLNDMSERINIFLGDITDSSESFADAADRFSDSLADLEDVFRSVSSGGSLSDDAKEEFESALREIGTMIDEIRASVPEPLSAESYREDPAAFKGILDEKKEEIEDVLTYVKDNLADAVDRIVSAVEHLKESGELSEESGKALEKAIRDLKDASGNLSTSGVHVGDAFHSIHRAIEDQSDLPPVEFPGLPDNYHKDKGELHDHLDKLFDAMRNLNDLANTGGRSFSDDLKRINNQLDSVVDVLRDSGEEEENNDLIVDISEEEAMNTTLGKIASCTNEGVVEGNVNVGGIVGAMAIEHDFDPEDNLVKDGKKSLNFKYYTRAVVHDCESRAAITSKKDYVGSIVGRMDLGAVLSCRGFGNIESTSGGKAGGIAGGSDGLIRDCWSKCHLAGKKNVGGIAGQGHDIRSCCSIVEISEEVPFCGAIAGDADGEVTGNVFVSENLGGIDSISYQGIAEPVSHEAMMTRENVPPEFDSLVITFMAEDRAIRTVRVRYGEKLEESKIPEVPEKEGFYGVWPEFERESVTFNQKVEAVYTPWLTAVSNKDGKILAEGRFCPDTILNSEKLEMEAPVDETHNLGVYRIVLPDEQEEFSAIRIAIPEGAKSAGIYCFEDGGWKKRETEKKDSYLRCEVTGNEVILCVAAEENPYRLLIPGAVLAVAVLVVLLILRKVIKRKKQKASREEAE